MPNELRDRVAIITGAGDGLGRSHARLMAELGAAVIVNDLKEDNAEAVAAEIREAGGLAEAFAGSVTDDERMREMVEHVVAEYEHLDVLVHNAGIVLDAPFHRMSREEVDRVLDIHLRAAVQLTLTAWPYMRETPGARIIATSSDSGLYGNRTQVNYDAAKMGLVGFVKGLAQEGQRAGIGVNAIVPVARTAMTDALFDQWGVTNDLDPRWVSVVVAYLASEACQETGMIWNAAGGYVGQTVIVETRGKVFNGSVDDFGPGDVLDALPEIRSLEGFTAPDSMMDKLAGDGGTLSLLSRLATKQ